MKSAHHAKVFISYSHKNPEWKDRLLRHLDVFDKDHLLDVWHDEYIPGGGSWEAEINQAMANARIAVVLLTQEALDSEFIREKELGTLRCRQERDGLHIIPFLCQPCSWQQHDWLRSIQVRPFEARPLSELPEVEVNRVLRNLATEIAEILSCLALGKLPKPDQPPPPDRVYLTKLPLTHTGRLIGREQELALLDLAFAQPHTAVVSLVAWGGVGKTALVQHWLNRLQREHWFGAGRIYAWSFYSQGTSENRQASEDIFLAHALDWFGVQCEPTLSPWDKGRLLADAVARERTLLILDGIEPLQYPPGPMGGQLRAPGVQALLRQLARNGHQGLCLVTSRGPLTDLLDYERRADAGWGSVFRVDLGNLAEEAGAALLHYTGANRVGAAAIPADDPELIAASHVVDGHALTLDLLGRFLARAHNGDLRKRRLVKFNKADAAVQGGHAYKVMAAYEKWLVTGGPTGQRQLAVLRLLGLFDRPADPGCMAALRQPPAIPDLTEPLADLSAEEWNLVISDLEAAGLVKTAEYVPQYVRGVTAKAAQQLGKSLEQRSEGIIELVGGPGNDVIVAGMGNVRLIGGEGNDEIFLDGGEGNDRLTGSEGHDVISYSLDSRPVQPEDFLPPLRVKAAGGIVLDAHPLLREHFGRQLRSTNVEAWRTGHQRLYEYFQASAPYWPERLAGLQPLYQAVAHGCQAELHQDAYANVYVARILRGTSGPHAFYSTKKLRPSAMDAELVAVACFFDSLWSRPVPGLGQSDRAWLLHQAAFRLCALGRLTEALEAMRAGLEMDFAQQDWQNGAMRASNLSELALMLGDTLGAVSNAELSVELADRSGNVFWRMRTRSALGDALHQAGRRNTAKVCFRKAEYLQAKRQPAYPVLYSGQGFLYCDLLLANAEIVAWQRRADSQSPRTAIATEPERRKGESEAWSRLLDRCQEVEGRAAQTLRWARLQNWLFDIALDHLTLGRIGLIRAELEPAELLQTSVLQTARQHITVAVDGLRASGHQEDIPHGLLSRAWLRFLEGDESGAHADLDEALQIAERGPMRLHMADIHLYRARLFSDKEELKKARAMIDRCGYLRRKKELEDAKEAAKGWA